MPIINLGILAHVDAGKTTTVEQMLFQSGELRALGSVDKGNTQTDFLAVERERGISVASATAVLEMDGIKINIIDTPGHMDFTGEVERALSALDGAVLVISAAEGIQSQTERFWKALREMGLPTIIFINKLDRFGCNPKDVLESLHTVFSPAVIPLNQYHNAGDTNVTVEDCQIDAILELCENDAALAELYLETGDVSHEALRSSLIRQTSECTAFPLVYGAAALGAGINTRQRNCRNMWDERRQSRRYDRPGT